MTDAKVIAGLVGPALVALGLTENPYVNPHLYDAQIPPVVYLSGTLLFIASVSLEAPSSLQNPVGSEQPQQP